MAEEDVKPKGVVAVFVGPTGQCIASVSDFERSGYGGYSLKDSQTVRVKDEIGRQVAEAFASSEFTKHLDRYNVQKVLSAMQSNDGYKLHIISVGHEEEE
jgi:hypothetical protein